MRFPRLRRARSKPAPPPPSRGPCPTCGCFTMRGSRGVNGDFRVCADPCHGPIPEPYKTLGRTFFLLCPGVILDMGETICAECWRPMEQHPNPVRGSDSWLYRCPSGHEAWVGK